jgi:hypothetical protein
MIRWTIRLGVLAIGSIACASPADTTPLVARANANPNLVRAPATTPAVTPAAAPMAPQPGVLDTSVMTALRNRSIRALDVLLVAPGTSERIAFEAARTRCEQLVVDDIDSWTLPTVGELVALGDAGFVSSDPHWSQTAADPFGDTRLAMFGQSRRVGAWTDNAQAVCVRQVAEPSDSDES